MIFNSQGAAELKQFINGGSITPGEEVTLPKGAQLLGDLTIEAITAGPLEVTPSSEQQIFTPAEGEYYNRVTVEAAESSEGSYGWEVGQKKSVTLHLTYASKLVIQLTSDDVDLSTIDSSFLVGFKSWYVNSNYPIIFTSATQMAVGQNATVFTYTYDPATARITMSNAISSNSLAYGDATKKCFVAESYAVSDNLDAYPECGEQDGKYYKLIGLPYAERLEYIRSTGTQHIDTEFKPNQDTRVVMDIESVASHSDIPLFGARVAYKNTAFSMWLRDAAIQTDYNSLATVISLETTQKRFVIDKNKNVTTADGVSVTQTKTTFQSAYSAYLFGLNQAGSLNSTGTVSIKMYSCQIYDNGTLARDYIPVLDYSGVACLYDRVERKFYYDAAGGEFEYELAA